jgi:EmrB/QacA subfamily drug resistance transporter
MNHAGPVTSRDDSPPPDRLDRDVLKVAAVVVLGSIMAILDTTVVNVALQQLTVEFHTSFDTIQWIATGYMLALAAVIPVTGWASDRFGTKRLYVAALALFLIGSVLAGLSWNIEALIGFRLLQGLGGGMLMPAGMTLLTRAAGPHRIGRVMALLGVPMLLGPIGGPILGGWLVDSVSWRWIFYINVPVGLVALWLSAVFLKKDRGTNAGRLDFLGIAMLSPGLALLLYGMAGVPAAGGVTDVAVWLRCWSSASS